MYDLNDTIVAVSSPSSGAKAIVRITGPDTIEIINQVFNTPVNIERETRDERRGTQDEGRGTSMIALTARHRQAVTEAIENIGEAINELQAGNDEVTAMMLRATYKSICYIEQQNVDDEILDMIFSRFCIGK